MANLAEYDIASPFCSIPSTLRRTMLLLNIIRARKMLIKDMTKEMCIELLKNACIGRIACTAGLQPYITPFSFAYETGFIYCFGTVGKKIETMRTNPLVCIEVENIVSREEWQTLVIQGRYEELSDTPQFSHEIDTAHDLMAKQPVWWHPGYARTLRADGERPMQLIWFRVSVLEISGHQAIPDKPIAQNPSALEAVRRNIRGRLRSWATALEMN
jgi:nitroimidazol reductase NimA-like FMN-containing flavoprotein (pyridoxamine 5'-phosphate oxidase superfamily)